MGMNLYGVTQELISIYYEDSHSYKVIASKNKELLEILKPTTPVKKITTNTINKYYLELKRRGNKPATIRAKMAYLHKLMKHCYNNWYIDKMPTFPTVKLKGVKDRFLTRHEIALMYYYCRWQHTSEYKELLNILIVSKNTGARISEVLSFDSEKDVENNYWRIWENKTNKPHSIPLNNKLQRRIKQYHIHFTINYQRAYYLFNKMCKDLNIQDVTIHTLRHTTASTLVQQGMPLYTVQKLLNHKSITTTQRYAHLKDDNLLEAVSML